MNIERCGVEGKVVINRKRGDWELLVKECEGSGKSWKEYCAEKGLNYLQFRRWISVFKR